MELPAISEGMHTSYLPFSLLDVAFHILVSSLDISTMLRFGCSAAILARMHSRAIYKSIGVLHCQMSNCSAAAVPTHWTVLLGHVGRQPLGLSIYTLLYVQHLYSHLARKVSWILPLTEALMSVEKYMKAFLARLTFGALSSAAISILTVSLTEAFLAATLLGSLGACQAPIPSRCHLVVVERPAGLRW